MYYSKLIAALLAVGLAAPAMAQTKDFTIGVRAGGNLGLYSESEKTENVEFNPGFGFNGGVVSIFRPGLGTFAFAPALHYNSMATAIESKAEDMNGNTATLESAARFNFISLDLTGRAYFTSGKVAPYALLGLRNNFLLGTGFTLADEVKTIADIANSLDPSFPSGDKMEEDANNELKKQTQSYYLQGVVGVGVQISNFFVEAEFAPGITRLNKKPEDSGAKDVTSRMHTVGLNLGITF